MRKIILLMMLYGWSHKAMAQSETSLEQYYYMQDKTVSLMPLIWYQAANGWYAEGRYNYEAEKTFSMYAGKTIENLEDNALFSYAVSPMIGVVVGNFNGGSVALNTDIEYGKFFFSVQSQYTFSVENRAANFIYNWCDIGFNTFNWLSAGLSLQKTNLCEKKSEKGFFIKAEFGAWVLPLYLFNPEKKDRYTVLGLNYTWQQKKKISNISKHPNHL